jgi:hypothetical protein
MICQVDLIQLSSMRDRWLMEIRFANITTAADPGAANPRPPIVAAINPIAAPTTEWIHMLANQIAEAGAGSILEARIPFQGLRSRQLADEPVHGRHREVGLPGELGERERSPHREGAQDRNDLAGDGAARLARVAGHPANPFDHVGFAQVQARG